MDAVKILHFADLHIGRKLSHLPPRKAALRNTEVLLSLENTLERFDDAKVVLMSGDIFENDVPFSSVEFVVNLLKRHQDKRFFIACGNHDCIEYNAIKTFISMLPVNAHVFSDSIERIVLDEYNLAVYGASFSAPGLYSSLLSGFVANDKDKLSIMVLHADVDSNSHYNPITYDEIANCGVDYLALGHVHSFSGVKQKNGVSYAYPGVLEPGGFDETGECGVIYGQIFKGATNLAFYPVSKRQYHNLCIDISDCNSNDEVAALISKAIDRNDLYKIVFVGSPNLASLDFELYTDIADAFYAEFSDECHNKKSIFDYINESSLRGAAACALSDLKNTCDEAVYSRASEILTRIMCKE